MFFHRRRMFHFPRAQQLATLISTCRVPMQYRVRYAASPKIQRSLPALISDSSPLIVEPTGSGLTLARVALTVLRGRRIILGAAIIFAAAGGALAIITPKTYSSTFSFLAQSGEGSGLGSVVGLAAQFGVSVPDAEGGGGSPQLFLDLLRARQVLTSIALDSFSPNPSATPQPLSTLLGVKNKDSVVVLNRTVERLQDDVIVSATLNRETGLVSVRLRAHTPWLAFVLSERLLLELNRFQVATRRSRAKQEKDFLDSRLRIAQRELRNAEDSLQRFVGRNQIVGGTSYLSLQRERLQRQVDLKQTLFVGIAQQAEEAKLREVRDTPVISIIDPPLLPAESDSRGPVVLLLLGGLLGLLVGTAVVIGRHVFGKGHGGTDPDFAELLDELRRTPSRQP
jgi:tyrosine-protein kinase Etk/Wzc